MSRLPFDVPPEADLTWEPAPDEFDEAPVEEPADEEVELAPARRRFSRPWGARPPSTPSWQNLPLRVALGGAVVFVVALLLTAGGKGYRDLQVVRQREAALAVRIAASEERLEDLRHRLQLLRDDPATLERLAREELGLVGKDDIVFVLPSDPAP